MNQPNPPQPPPMGPTPIGPGPMGGPPPGPYPPYPPPQPPRRRRIWPWVAGGVLVVVLAVLIGAGIIAMITNTTNSKVSSSPTPTHTYPENYPEQKLPAQIDGYKRDPSDPSIYQILRPSKANPNVVDVNNSDRIGADDMGIPFREGGPRDMPGTRRPMS